MIHLAEMETTTFPKSVAQSAARFAWRSKRLKRFSGDRYVSGEIFVVKDQDEKNTHQNKASTERGKRPYA